MTYEEIYTNLHDYASGGHDSWKVTNKESWCTRMSQFVSRCIMSHNFSSSLRNSIFFDNKVLILIRWDESYDIIESWKMRLFLFSLKVSSNKDLGYKLPFFLSLHVFQQLTGLNNLHITWYCSPLSTSTLFTFNRITFILDKISALSPKKGKNVSTKMFSKNTTKQFRQQVDCDLNKIIRY